MTRTPSNRPTKSAAKKKAPRSVLTHVFLRGGQENHAGEAICEYCGHLYSHRIHDLLIPENAVEVADRIVGEGHG